MFTTITWISLLAVVLVQVLLIFVLLRYRKSRQPKAAHAHGRPLLELVYTLIPALILVWIAFASQTLWARIQVSNPTSAHTVHVEVMAQQFAWNIRYPGPDGIAGRTDAALVTDEDAWGRVKDDPAGRDDVYTINQMHLPIQRPASILLRSKDVIHSFFVPQMRIKQDMIPGSSIEMKFTPTSAGEFEIACAEFCGLAHYRMRGILTVGSEAEHNTWLTEQAQQQ